jgi:hypothetical protein
MTILDDLGTADYEDWDDESYDGSYDDEAEFLGSIIPGAASAIGGLVSNLFGRRPPRPPLPSVSVGVPGAGVSTATLATPQGNATLRLPAPVVTRQEFDAGLRRVQEGINRNTARLNTVTRDVDTLTTRVGAVTTQTQKDIAAIKAANAKTRVAQRTALVRLRREASQQQMLTMVMAMTAQRSAQKALEGHTHDASGDVVSGSGGSSSSSMLMMLPLMMSSGGGGGGESGGDSSDSTAMMLPLMMLAIGSGS